MVSPEPGFATRADELPGVVFGGHGENLNTVFLIACGCGHDRNHVLGHYWRDPDDDTLADPDTYGTVTPSFLEKVHERAGKLLGLRLSVRPRLERQVSIISDIMAGSTTA